VEQALTEIREETGREDPRLLVAGAPLTVPAPEYETRYLVHPFLFHLPSDDLQLDWEHTEARFVRLDKLSDFDTVPGLRDAFDAAAAPTRLTVEIDAIIDRIRKDRARGASDLAAEALDALALCRLAGAFHGAGCADWRAAAARFATLRPGIEAIRTAVARGALEASSAVDEGDAAEALFATRDRLVSARDAAARVASEWLESRSAGRLMTLSRSGAVTATFEAMAPATEIRVLESRPGGEGFDLARELAAGGRRVSVFPDAAVFSALEGCDAALIGADGVLADGDVVNKVGSAALAAAARARGIPFLVVVEGIKASPTARTTDLEAATWTPGDDGAVAQAAPLFERVPGGLIDGIATEGGIASPGGLAAAAERLRSSLTAAGLWTLFYG